MANTKIYTEEEKQAYLEQGKSAGRRGIKLPRINLAFTTTNYEYIQTMARATGQTMTAFINQVLEQHRAAHMDTLERMQQFRKELDNLDK